MVTNRSWDALGAPHVGERPEAKLISDGADQVTKELTALTRSSFAPQLEKPEKSTLAAHRYRREKIPNFCRSL